MNILGIHGYRMNRRAKLAWTEKVRDKLRGYSGKIVLLFSTVTGTLYLERVPYPE